MCEVYLLFSTTAIMISGVAVESNVRLVRVYWSSERMSCRLPLLWAIAWPMCSRPPFGSCLEMLLPVWVRGLPAESWMMTCLFSRLWRVRDMEEARAIGGC